jgi:hypothetical protein
VSWRIYLIYCRNMGYALFSACVSLFMLYQIFTMAGSVWLSYWSDNSLPFVVDGDEGGNSTLSSLLMDEEEEEGGGNNSTEFDSYLARR